MTCKNFTKNFRDEAVNLALNSGLTREQLASDLGVGKSTLNKWVTDFRKNLVRSSSLISPTNDLRIELIRLCKENKILREERDILRKSSFG